MSFKVYKFVADESIMALPTSWEKSGKVPYGPSARQYIEKEKEPPKGWKMYEVTPLDNRIYTSYSAALEAEVLLMHQSDVNSSDFERINAPQNKKNLTVKKRKAHNPPLPPVTPVESEESSDDGFCDLPAVPVKRALSCYNSDQLLAALSKSTQDASQNANLTQTPATSPTFSTTEKEFMLEISANSQQSATAPEQRNQKTAIEEIHLENEGEVQTTPVVQIQPTNTEPSGSTAQISPEIDMSFVISPRHEAELPYDQNKNGSDVTALITQTSEDTIVVENVLYSFDENTLRRIIREELAAFQTKGMQESSTITFEKMHHFPLENLNEPQKFDKEFENNSNLKQNFISYVKRRGGTNVKKHLEIVNRMYSISLQESVSYTGRQGKKFALMNLHHITTLIGTLASVHDDTESNVTSALRTYLHQTCTRKAAAKKKFS